MSIRDIEGRQMPASEVIVKVSSNIGSNCAICNNEFLDGTEDFEKACNHLLSHGLKCLHVGQETISGEHGEPWHTTVAVFGK